MITRTHDAKKLGDDNETSGQLGVKFWRYITWQAIEKSVRWRGSESKEYMSMWRAIMAYVITKLTENACGIIPP